MHTPCGISCKALSYWQASNFRMPDAVIWGGMLIVMAPLYSIQTLSRTRKQQAFGVWTRTSCEVERSQTSRLQRHTRRTHAFMVTVSVTLDSILVASKEGCIPSYSGGGRRVQRVLLQSCAIRGIIHRNL